MLDKILEMVSKWEPGGQFVFILLCLIALGGFMGGLGTFITVLFRGYPTKDKK